MQPRNKSNNIEKQDAHSDEQGFFAQKIQIKKSAANHNRSNSQHTKSNFYKSSFEAKFLPWTGNLKKEPIQALQTSLICPSQDSQKIQRKKNKNLVQGHPYKLFATNQQYQLVYNRNKFEPIVNDKYFMSNQISLFHVGIKNPNLKKIKDFEINQFSQIKINSLAFDSRFQSGNLHCVYKNEKSNEYILFIENDTNSLGYNQWFYFSVQRNQANLKYTFKIVNFKKKHSFFKHGCKPAVFSMHDAKTKGQGWSRRGSNVSYQQSPIYIQQLPNSKFYCLSFDLTFDHKDDYILIAMSLPYSYSKLISFIKQSELLAQQNPTQSIQFSVKSICTSICGNDIPQITITKKSEINKKMIIMMARQHPGQIWSSYMIQEMIRKLLQSKQDQSINWLLSNYIFKIYPMVNVDGVIYGNFRCDITGTDLNRRWKQTSRLMYPQVYQIKNSINYYKNNYKIQCCFDLHGHSKQYNIFCYSCKNNQYTCRLLPLIINKINNVFHFPSCTFGISRYKQTTARAAIYKLIKNQNVLTIQSSFYGSKINNQVKQFSPADLFKMGYDILVASRHFLQKRSKIYLMAKKQAETRIDQFTNFDKSNQQNSGSESDPSGDQIDLQTKMKSIFNKQLISIQDLSGKKSQKPKVKSIDIKFQQQNMVKKTQIILEIKQETKVNKIKQFQIKKPKIKPAEQPRCFEQVPITQVPIMQSKNNKKTISYTLSKKNNKQQELQINKSNMLNKEKQKKFTFRTIDQPKSQRPNLERKSLISKHNQKNESLLLMRQSIEAKELEKRIQSVRKSDEFIKKFQKFIPISMSIKNRTNVTMFQQSIYNQDQSGLISMLIQNKKKIQIEKIKRNVQKSTYLAERQGKIKLSNRQEKVVNFKSLKQNEKINKQIRKLASVSNYTNLQ